MSCWRLYNTQSVGAYRNSLTEKTYINNSVFELDKSSTDLSPWKRISKIASLCHRIPIAVLINKSTNHAGWYISGP